MTAYVARFLFVAFFGAVLFSRPAGAQKAAPSPYAAACGPAEAKFTVKHSPATANPSQPPPGKALVYIIESMTDYPFITKQVNMGLDGSWIGGTDAMTHISFTVDPGVHHLCAVYQGHAASMDEEGRILLLHLNAQAGKVYYLRYHAFITQGGGIASFEAVDEDEGLFLVQSTDQATSKLKN